MVGRAEGQDVGLQMVSDEWHCNLSSAGCLQIASRTVTSPLSPAVTITRFSLSLSISPPPNHCQAIPTEYMLKASAFKPFPEGSSEEQ